MTILLLNPPARRPGLESLVVPPLGLAYLAAVLRQAGYEVKIKDAFAEGLGWEALGAYLAGMRPDILGLSSMAPTIDLAYKTVQLARPYAKHIVMGGPQISVLGQAIFQQCPELDFGVIGEGEETMVELVGALAAGRSPEGIPGVISPDFQGPPRKLIEDLDSLPFPARELLPSGLYKYPFARHKRVTTLFTSRGCPYQCIFCDKSVFGSRWRARSAENILSELDEIVHRHHINSIIIYDDLFTLKKKRVQEICDGIIRRGYQLDWKCEGRVDLVDLETLNLMKRAGCSMIAYGVESGNQIGLDYLNKKTKLEQIRRAFSLTHQAGIETMAYFILGIPVESFADELETIRFAKEINPTYVQFSSLSPYYGTRLYQEATEKNWFHQVEAHNPMDKDLQRPVVLSPQWSPEDLQRIMRQAHLSFYLRPGYIFKRLTTIKSLNQLINVSRGFLALGRWLAH
jgi:radical SAM superfamily enzyme YgiQ (UPF0313 family)